MPVWVDLPAFRFAVLLVWGGIQSDEYEADSSDTIIMPPSKLIDIQARNGRNVSSNGICVICDRQSRRQIFWTEFKPLHHSNRPGGASNAEYELKAY